MVNYNNGKIYKIENLGGDMCYIGSTTKDYLSKRMVQHRAMYKRWLDIDGASNFTVFNIFEKYGLHGCRIVLVELFPCDTKDELLKREAYHINAMACVNKCRPIRTKQERIDYNKQFYQENKANLEAYQKAYRVKKKHHYN